MTIHNHGVILYLQDKSGQHLFNNHSEHLECCWPLVKYFIGRVKIACVIDFSGFRVENTMKEISHEISMGIFLEIQLRSWDRCCSSTLAGTPGLL